MSDRLRWPLAGALLCAASLALLALLAYGVDPTRVLDNELLARISAHQESTPGGWAEVIVHLGDPLPLICLLAGACAIALARGRSDLALAAVAAVAGANLTTETLKQVLAHPKAQELLGTDGHPVALAFPSGHATAAASIVVAFGFVVPRALLPLTLGLGAIVAIAVGCSVVLLAWHHPSDVLGGYLVAAGWGFAVLTLLRARELRRAREGALNSSPGPLPSR